MTVDRIFPSYALDLDGTIYLGDALLPEAKRAVETLRTAGSCILFLSNNPLQTRADYAAKLNHLGVPAAPDEVINSSWVLARWLEREAPGARLFVVGEAPLLGELRAAGFRLTEEPGAVEFVVASFDRTFDYRKLQIAFDAIRAGARFVATNGDRYCPALTGGLPDAAAVIGAIEGCTGKQVEVVVGKPSPIAARAILDQLRLPASECIIVGDRRRPHRCHHARATGRFRHPARLCAPPVGRAAFEVGRIGNPTYGAATWTVVTTT
ncbi:MAG TPA: HAD-IIA family hydrolase [Thermoflexia bacterium]|nr:HAD-IIA family hydrolase [Thermoflexia bacterium]